MFGQSLLAKIIVQGTVGALGVDPSTAETLGELAKWGVRIATFDIGGQVAENVFEEVVTQVGEGGAEYLLETSGEEVMNAGLENLAADATVAGYATALAETSAISGPPIADYGPVAQWVNVISQAANGYSIPVFAQANVHNAFCYLGSIFPGDEMIVFDPAFLQSHAEKYGTEAGIGILAHEVGHAHCGVLFPGVVDWTDERRADYFAGQVFARFNLNLQPFLAALQNLSADARHPFGALRVQDVLQGYLAAGGMYPNGW